MKRKWLWVLGGIAILLLLLYVYDSTVGTIESRVAAAMPYVAEVRAVYMETKDEIRTALSAYREISIKIKWIDKQKHVVTYETKDSYDDVDIDQVLWLSATEKEAIQFLMLDERLEINCREVYQNYLMFPGSSDFSIKLLYSSLELQIDDHPEFAYIERVDNEMYIVLEKYIRG